MKAYILFTTLLFGLFGCATPADDISSLSSSKFLYYGTFCGPGYPKVDESLSMKMQLTELLDEKKYKPKDDIDRACRDHDICYTKAQDFEDYIVKKTSFLKNYKSSWKRNCDEVLIRELSLAATTFYHHAKKTLTESEDNKRRLVRRKRRLEFTRRPITWKKKVAEVDDLLKKAEQKGMAGERAMSCYSISTKMSESFRIKTGQVFNLIVIPVSVANAILSAYWEESQSCNYKY